ncbi:MAG: YfcE family phosphodiesterase [Candidatus Hodarchaeota archaeon]
MLKLLAIGDSHIPRRAKRIPDKIIEKLNQLTETELFKLTFFTGDLIQAPKFLNFLNLKTKGELLIVIGNMDHFGGNRDAPMFQKSDLTFSDKEVITIGLTHGHQISPRGDLKQLELLAIEKEFNILISGHTHKEEVFLTEKGILLLNPGSVTGAWSFIASNNPSFITLNFSLKTQEIDVNLFQLDIRSSKLNNLRSHFIFQNNRIKYK